MNDAQTKLQDASDRALAGGAERGQLRAGASGASSSTPKTNRRRTYLACVGDATHPDSWSSIPYHLLEAGQRAGVIDAGLPLQIERRSIRARRVVRSLWRVLLGDSPGGFQYTASFLETLWKPVKEMIRGGRIIQQSQFFPPSVLRDPSIEKWFYTDATLTLLQNHYHNSIGRRLVADVLRRERENYQAARGIVLMSNFAAQSVINDYGIAPEKVHVVVPGANILPADYKQWEAEQADRRQSQEEGPLRLVFVGRDPIRKGLDRLLRALIIARGQRLQATLRVIGCTAEQLPANLRDVPGVEWCGHIHRKAEGKRFFRLLSECQVGCLLSRAEFSAIGLREYLAMGMVVLGPNVGGCGDLMIRDASVAVPPEASDEEIAAILLRFQTDPDRFEQMRATAWAERRTALWDNSVAQLADLLRR